MNGLTWSLRPISDDDWSDILVLANAAAPWADNRPWLQNRQQFAQSVRRARYYLACDGEGVSRGFGAIEEASWSAGKPPDGSFRVFVVLESGLIPDLGPILLQRLKLDAAALGASRLWVREETRDPILRFFLEQGFGDLTAFRTDDGDEIQVMKMDLARRQDSGD